MTVIARKKTTTPANGVEALKDALVGVLDDNKAEDIVVVSLEGKSSIADYMIIASGRSARHVSALADMIGQYMKTRDYTTKYEGKSNGDWVLADAGDVIVHLFRPEVRSFYNLEKIWCDPLEQPETPIKKRKKA